MKKRMMSMALAVCLLLSAGLAVPQRALAAEPLTLAQLRAKFPAGKYWNHAGNPGKEDSKNNQDGWTNTPCPEHHTVGTGKQTCNAFLPPGSGQLSWQCMGYAEKLGYDSTGYNPRNNANGWYTYESSSALNNVKPGDIVRFKNGSNYHSIFITAVNGETLTYTDCNHDGHCVIRWDQTISKSTLRANFIHLRSGPGLAGSEPAAPSGGSVITDKAVYRLGESVTVSAASDEMYFFTFRVENRSGTIVFDRRDRENTEPVSFTPQDTGDYTVYASLCRDWVHYTDVECRFSVTVPPSDPRVSTDKSSYEVGEQVTISASGSGMSFYTLKIMKGGETVYTSYEENTGTSVYTPDAAGTYTVRSSLCATWDIFSDAACTFTVTEPVHVHSLTKTAEKAPACTAKGNQAYWTCDGCGKVFSDAQGKNETTVSAMTVKALGHDYVNGVCTRCGAEEPHTHSLTKTAAEAATCTEPGNQAYWTCTGCGKVFSNAAGTRETTVDARTIAPLGHSYENGTCTRCGEKDPDYTAPVIAAGTAEVLPGGEFTVPVTITNNPGIYSAALTVACDCPGLTLTAIERGEVFSGGTFTPTLGTGRVQWRRSTGNAAGDGVLFLLKGTVSQGAEKGGWPVTVSLLNDSASNLKKSFSQTIPADFVPGTVRVRDPVEVTAAAADGGLSVTVDVFTGLTYDSGFCAAYDGDGRMLAAAPLASGGGKQTFVLPCDGSRADRVKVFLLDAGLCPVAKAAECRAGT